MTLAKAAVTGTVYRAPEKRFTGNNIAISAFVLDIGEKDEILVRVISTRTFLDEVVSSLTKGDRILVDGRLQVTNAKMDDGTEKRIFEIEASIIEKIGGNASPARANNNEEIVKFAQDDFSDELIGEDEIPF